jgi:hypothetical protein
LKCIILKGGMHRKRHSTGKKIEIWVNKFPLLCVIVGIWGHGGRSKIKITVMSSSLEIELCKWISKNDSNVSNTQSKSQYALQYLAFGGFNK